MEEKCKIICGDALEILNTLPDELVDCVVTSPPYWRLRDYKTKDIIWDGEKDCEHEWNTEITKLPNASGGQGEASKVQLGNKGSNFTDYNKRETRSAFCIKCHAWKGSLGLEPTFDLYIKHLCDIFDEVKRVLKKTGTVWVNIGDTYSATRWSESAGTSFMAKSNPENIYGEVFAKNTGLPDKSLCNIPARFSIEMQKRGWILRNEIIWFKRNCMPSSVSDRFTIDFEKIFFFVKQGKYYFETQREGNNECYRNPTTSKSFGGSGHIGNPANRPNRSIIHTIGRNKRCVWDITTQPFNEAHFATFPEELCETPIKAGCPSGGVVLDMFMGSGTTGLVAMRQGKKFIGIELNPKYIEIAERRLHIEKDKTNINDFLK